MLKNKTVRYCLYSLGGVIMMAVTFLVVSYLIVSKAETKPFFESREGENTPLVFSHQGGEGIRPTNTMIAFEDSIDLGADVLDADMHMSKDGVLVLAHDETVDRTSNGTGAIRDLTYEQLLGLDFGHNFTTDDGQTYPFRGKGHTIVTAGELFDKFNDTRFGIEIKQTTTEAANKFCELIKSFGYEDRVLVSSFAQENMDVFREECPNVATSATEDEARRFYIFQLLRLSGFYSPPFDALQVPEYSGDTHVLNGHFVATAKRHGLPIIPWTINEIADFERLINDFDVEGINTNYPDRLGLCLQMLCNIAR